MIRGIRKQIEFCRAALNIIHLQWVEVMNGPSHEVSGSSRKDIWSYNMGFPNWWILQTSLNCVRQCLYSDTTEGTDLFFLYWRKETTVHSELISNKSQTSQCLCVVRYMYFMYTWKYMFGKYMQEGVSSNYEDFHWRNCCIKLSLIQQTSLNYICVLINNCKQVNKHLNVYSAWPILEESKGEKYLNII